MRYEIARVLRMKQQAIIFLGGKCIDCGWSGHHAGFEFDHVKGRGTRHCITYSFAHNSWKRIKLELDDGIDLVCGTCHNIRTYERRLAPTELAIRSALELV